MCVCMRPTSPNFHFVIGENADEKIHFCQSSSNNQRPLKCSVRDIMPLTFSVTSQRSQGRSFCLTFSHCNTTIPLSTTTNEQASRHLRFAIDREFKLQLGGMCMCFRK